MIETRERVVEWARWQHEHGLQVAFTNGCFEILHAGHTYTLWVASCEAGEGGMLIVGVNDDASFRRARGRDPVAKNRAGRVACLGCVDHVVEFPEDDPGDLVRAIRPDVLVKGADYALDEIIPAEDVVAWGGRVVRASMVPGVSTTDIIRRCRALPRGWDDGKGGGG